MMTKEEVAQVIAYCDENKISCKALEANPREWMENVLLRIPGNENNREALRKLLPDKWAKQTN